jgi:hypothetical protein
MFITGTSANGYMLNSIQLGMTDATGNPSGFMVMLYTATGLSGIFPGSSIGTLNGSLNPVTAGTNTYTPASSLTLSPSTDYFIVLTAGTAVGNGAYEWSSAGTYSYNPNGGWQTFANSFHSSNGSSWNSASSSDLQFAINATAVPEPSSSFLLLLGSGVFIYVRRACRR